jgi:hypothetical protein
MEPTTTQSPEDKIAELAQSNAIQQKVTELMLSLQENILSAFPRHALKHSVAPTDIQFAIRFDDLENGEGEIYYQVFVKWKPLEDRAHFGIDICGNDSLFPDPDTIQKQQIIEAYLVGINMMGITQPGKFHEYAEKYNIKVWSHIQAVFYLKDNTLFLGIYVNETENGVVKSKLKEKIDITAEFNLTKESAPQEEKVQIDNAPEQVQAESVATAAAQEQTAESVTQEETTAVNSAPDGFAK